ncbi:DUF6301 family protein [Arachnia propionica]|uniref:DUF6301 family protein n=1 Tax=Arachnia propionica TaxID=1750 RepID=UPI0030D2560A
MIIFPPQDFITWTNTLVQFPWPIQLNDFTPYAEKLGWKPTSLPDEFSVLPDNDDEITILSSDRDGNVRNLFLYMASNEAEDDEGAAELNDHFVSCVAAGKKAWGNPFLLEAGGGPGVTWRFPGDMFAQVTGGSRAVLFNFFTPQGKYQFL